MANPQQTSRVRELVERTSAIARYYHSLIGDAPYPSFTVALIEHRLPGGHSPAYFAVLNQPLPDTPLTWRNDPAAFDNYPEFFLAHELAHQWWGQAIGWDNYHEQWLSEGFAQYFAALYANHHRGPQIFGSILRHMGRWAAGQSDQGPVYLGYRLGHLRDDGRIFRALVYNKGAVVLHMLRQLVGDAAFFDGLRLFYGRWRYQKAGTRDLQVAMEETAGRSLDRFFERWIYSDTLPKLRFRYDVGESPLGPEVVLRFEQDGDLFDVPVTVTLLYADRRSVEVLVRVDDRSVEVRVPLTGILKGVEISRDSGMIGEVSRVS
jgi:aminopeptidase N